VDTALNSLSQRTKPLAIHLLARCTEARIQVVIINTLRTPAEQAAALASGHSWVKHSKHQDGDAFDIAPLDVYLLHGPDKICWSAADPVWERLGMMGESVGLAWGGRWKVKDLGHFEYRG
jgi:peptidoglycan L-alanyl-D-glutamate endopeptidase CwlK